MTEIDFSLLDMDEEDSVDAATAARRKAVKDVDDDLDAPARQPCADLSETSLSPA
ncbi:MAG: hypothetical protein AAF684_01325 [Pseudomonadota bacterium]